MPDRGTEHVSTPLSNVANGYKNAAHIWSQVVAPVPVEKEVDLFFTFGREFLRYRGVVRANHAEAERIDSYSASTTEYVCKEHAYSDTVTDRDRSKADAKIDPDTRVVNSLMKTVDLDCEVDAAALIFGASNYTSMTAAPTNKWDITNADGDPFGDIDAAILAVQKAIGVKPNTMTIGSAVFNQLKRHPDVLEYFKYTGKPIVTPEMLAQAFGIDKVLVGEAIYITSKQGQGTVTTDHVWGKSCAITYVPANPAMEEPAHAYNFMHMLFGGLTAMVQRIPAPKKGKGGVDIEVSRSYVMKATGQYAGYLYTAVVS